MDQQQAPTKLQYVIYETQQLLEHLKATPDAELSPNIAGFNTSSVKQWLQDNPQEAKEIFASMVAPQVERKASVTASPIKRLSQAKACVQYLKDISAPQSIREVAFYLDQNGYNKQQRNFSKFCIIVSSALNNLFYSGVIKKVSKKELGTPVKFYI